MIATVAATLILMGTVPEKPKPIIYIDPKTKITWVIVRAA